MSYNRQNQYRARLLKAHLEKMGVFVWRAPEDVPIGEDYEPVEMEAIEQCSLFLLLLSPASQESAEVRKEVEKARTLGKKLLPLLLGSFEMNDYYKAVLSKHQWRQLEGEKKEELDIRSPSAEEARVLSEIADMVLALRDGAAAGSNPAD